LKSLFPRTTKIRGRGIVPGPHGANQSFSHSKITTIIENYELPENKTCLLLRQTTHNDDIVDTDQKPPHQQLISSV